MMRAGKTTSGLNTISTGNVKHVRVPLPPLSVQQQYVALRSQVVSTRNSVQTSQQEADALFDSLAQRAFVIES